MWSVLSLPVLTGVCVWLVGGAGVRGLADYNICWCYGEFELREAR